MPCRTVVAIKPISRNPDVAALPSDSKPCRMRCSSTTGTCSLSEDTPEPTTSIRSIERATVSSGPSPTLLSSTSTVTRSFGLLAKSSVTPAISQSSGPTISNSAASAPDRIRLLVPGASSIITISATLIPPDVLVSSRMLLIVLARLTVGGSFTSVIAIDNGVASSGVEPMATSSTSTVTSRPGFVSKSRLLPAIRRISVPIISNISASSPLRLSMFSPRPSSVTTISATLMALDVSRSSGKVVVALISLTVGGWFTSMMLLRKLK